MLEIKFRYRDEMSNGEWREQSCIVDSVQACKDIYGLDSDSTIIEYEILEIKRF